MITIYKNFIYIYIYISHMTNNHHVFKYNLYDTLYTLASIIFTSNLNIRSILVLDTFETAHFSLGESTQIQTP